MKRTIPVFRTDEEAEKFVDTADLSTFDLSGFKPAHFEFKAKDTQLNMRVSESLLDAVKAKAAASGMPYTRYIRMVLERAVG
jgi:predicted DNA binding CopG/RHH family protein